MLLLFLLAEGEICGRNPKILEKSFSNCIVFGNKQVKLDRWILVDTLQKIWLKLDVLKFYLMIPSVEIGCNFGARNGFRRLAILKNKKLAYQTFLLDLQDTNSLVCRYGFDGIQRVGIPCEPGGFGLGNIRGILPLNLPANLLFGVDSLLQVSGVQSGALDPLKGMYWTWQTGYIQFKMEGILSKDTLGEGLIPIQLHLGGFQGESNCQQRIFEDSMVLSGVRIDPPLGTGQNGMFDSAVAMEGGLPARDYFENAALEWNIKPLVLILLGGGKSRMMAPSKAGRELCELIANSVRIIPIKNCCN